MSYRSQLLCIWCGPVMALGFFVGLAPLAGFIPPPSPTESAQQIAEMFAADPTKIRIGLFVAMLSTGMLCPFYAAIAVQMKRVEGGSRPLTYAQMIAGAVTVVAIILPLMIWQAAAFRPERDPASTQLLNDVAWIMFVATTATVIIQNIVIGAAVLQDKRVVPILPRWFGYLNFWVALGVMPATPAPIFKTGPLAWNGILAWWMGVISFFIFVLSATIVLHRSVRTQRAEEPAERSVGSIAARGTID
ncbi:hypothetical protein MycrhDRAFT_1600 [Mycolicibacterium rhodesiae JS60]|nr:hypothetical protein MycrhDRAFT_1600 [Mycolicibacterium rhodesiae JS60]